MPSYADLPGEIWTLVAVYLDLKEVLRLSACCRGLRHEVGPGNLVVWKNQFRQIFDQPFDIPETGWGWYDMCRGRIISLHRLHQEEEWETTDWDPVCRIFRETRSLNSSHLETTLGNPAWVINSCTQLGCSPQTLQHPGLYQLLMAHRRSHTSEEDVRNDWRTMRLTKGVLPFDGSDRAWKRTLAITGISLYGMRRLRIEVLPLSGQDREQSGDWRTGVPTIWVWADSVLTDSSLVGSCLTREDMTWFKLSLNRSHDRDNELPFRGVVYSFGIRKSIAHIRGTMTYDPGSGFIRWRFESGRTGRAYQYEGVQPFPGGLVVSGEMVVEAAEEPMDAGPEGSGEVDVEVTDDYDDGPEFIGQVFSLWPYRRLRAPKNWDDDFLV